MNRRQILTGALCAAALLAAPGLSLPGPAQAAEMPVYPDDRILGSPDAPITMIEYASLTCPHCAHLHATALKKIKKNWIADGKVRLVFRHYPLDGLALRAAAVTDCFKGDRFFAFLDLLYENQKRWATAKDPLAVLGQYAKLAGMTQKRFDACVNDKADMDKILQRAREARDKYQVNSTPTSFINGTKVEGAQPYATFEAIFKKLAPGT
jgi:protein-disulfide isomerase